MVDVVVRVYFCGVVDVVRGDADRASESGRGAVAEPVDPVETRAVAQMETSNRIERFRASLGVNEVRSAEGQQRRLHVCPHVWITEPCGIVERRHDVAKLTALPMRQLT